MQFATQLVAKNIESNNKTYIRSRIKIQLSVIPKIVANSKNDISIAHSSIAIIQRQYLISCLTLVCSIVSVLQVATMPFAVATSGVHMASRRWICKWWIDPERINHEYTVRRIALYVIYTEYIILDTQHMSSMKRHTANHSVSIMLIAGYLM